MVRGLINHQIEDRFYICPKRLTYEANCYDFIVGDDIQTSMLDVDL